MICSYCGNKNPKDARFCAHCGQKVQDSFQFRINKKLLFKISSFFIVVLGLYVVFHYMTSPKRIVQRYMKDLVHGGKDFYQTLILENDTTFTQEEIFSSILQSQEMDSFKNYKIINITIQGSKGKALISQNSGEKNFVIPLVKNKKFLVPIWEIDLDPKDYLLEDFSIIVPKHSKVKYGGVLVESNYLNSKQSTDSTDVYILKQVFTFKTNIQVELPNGYMMEDSVTPGSYKKKYVATLSLDHISEQDQQTLLKTIKNDLEILYQGGIEDRSFEQIQTDLSCENETFIKTTYQTWKNNLKQSDTELQSIHFTSLQLTEAKLEEGILKIEVKANYQYKIQYPELNGTMKQKESESYRYIDFYYQMKNKNYHLTDVKNLSDYFSKY